MQATLCWVRADLRSHRLPSALVVLATAGTVMALLLAGALLNSATGAWSRQFAASSGAHVWIETTGSAPIERLRATEGVTAVAGPMRTATAAIVSRRPSNDNSPSTTAERIPLTLRAADPTLPQVSRPLLVAGTWLRPVVLNGIVVEHSLADTAWIKVGDRLAVQGSTGPARDLQVVGIAESPDRGPYPEVAPGLGWVLPESLGLVEPDHSRQGLAIGLRLAHTDANSVQYAAQRAVTAVGGDQVAQVSTWLEARDLRRRDDRLTGLLLAWCGLATLIAGAIAVAGAVGGRIRGRVGDIAMLKVLGFTPGQIVRLFALQHTLLAGAGALLGALGAALAARWSSGFAAATPSGWSALPGGAFTAVAVSAVTLGAIAPAAAVPAFRVRRLVPIPVGDGVARSFRQVRAARLRLLRRLPPAVVLGLRAAFQHPGRALLMAVRLALPVLVCSLALATWATLDAFDRRAPGLGLETACTLRVTGRTDAAQVERILAASPGVAAAYPTTELTALIPGQSATMTLRAIGDANRPYPLTIAEGRGLETSGEAVVGQGALDLLGARLGQWVRVTTAGTPRILHIVGRTVEPERGGQVLSTRLDTLDRPTDPQAPGFYSLVLRPGVRTADVARELTATGAGRLDIRQTTNPLGQLGSLRGVAGALVVLPALVGLAELLTIASTGIQEGRTDLALLRTIGLTPGQSLAIVVTRGVVLTAVGVVPGVAVGVPAALALIDVQGAASGVGAGIAHGPSVPAMLTLVLGALFAAAVVSALPALRSARAPVCEAQHRS